MGHAFAFGVLNICILDSGYIPDFSAVWFAARCCLARASITGAGLLGKGCQGFPTPHPGWGRDARGYDVVVCFPSTHPQFFLGHLPNAAGSCWSDVWMLHARCTSLPATTHGAICRWQVISAASISHQGMCVCFCLWDTDAGQSNGIYSFAVHLSRKQKLCSPLFFLCPTVYIALQQC